MKKIFFILIGILSAITLVSCDLGENRTPYSRDSSDTVSEEHKKSEAKEEERPNTEDDAPAAPAEIPKENAKQEEFKDKAREIEVYADKQRNNAMTQAEINMASKNIYDSWDAFLNEIYQYLKATMPAAEFSELEQDEIRWIKEKETAVEQESKQYEGASMYAMVRNETATQYTQDRCYYLISLIHE